MALDLRTGRLRGEPIMDPREPDEQMGGVPLTRTMSPDMRWVYTLYSGEHNFVHALDTKDGHGPLHRPPGRRSLRRAARRSTARRCGSATSRRSTCARSP